jgi:hypothetical protein
MKPQSESQRVLLSERHLVTPARVMNDNIFYIAPIQHIGMLPSRYHHLMSLLIAAITAVLWSHGRLLAADVTACDPQPETERLRINDLPHIQVTGEIVEGDADKLRKALAQMDARAVVHEWGPIVFLDSRGGNVAVALEMGRLLREALAQTFVVPDQTCASSCVFVFAGGVQRTVVQNGQLGLHRPRFDYEMFGEFGKDEARKAYTAAVDNCAKFLKEMGIGETVLSVMLKIPSEKIRWLRSEETEKFGLVGIDPAWQEWVRARDVRRMGEAKLTARDRYFDCLTSGGDKSKCYESYVRELRQLDDKSPHR